MNAGQRGMRRVVANGANFARDNICNSCLSQISQQSRRYAAAAAAVAEEPIQPPTSQQQTPSPATSSEWAKAYRILASPVISRPPLITRPLTEFEKAYYLYQKRLNERLALPFSRYFYYKKGTPADIEWKRKAARRKTAARDIGVYTGYGEEAWNDELLVGDQTIEPDSQREALILDAEGKEVPGAMPVGDKEANGEAVSGEGQVGEGVRKDLEIQLERPVPRITKADEKNDVKSLNRKQDQTLYLVVKNKDGHWRFPEGRLYSRENLEQAAERVIVQSGGINMNTWVVGNHPVGHYQHDYPKSQLVRVKHYPKEGPAPVEKQEQLGEKVFFMKARIMAGQADLSKNVFGDVDFQWLAKDEVERLVKPKYWSSVRNMLVER